MEEIEVLSGRFQVLKEQEQALGKNIENTEISHVRTEQIIKSINENSDRSKKKLVKIRDRLRHLLGDSIVLAASVAYLGVFNEDLRLEIRRGIAE